MGWAEPEYEGQKSGQTSASKTVGRAKPLQMLGLEFAKRLMPTCVPGVLPHVLLTVQVGSHALVGIRSTLDVSADELYRLAAVETPQLHR